MRIVAVCPYVRQVNFYERKESFACFLTPYDRWMRLVFQHEEWLVGDIPLYVKFWVKVNHPLQKRRLPVDIHL